MSVRSVHRLSHAQDRAIVALLNEPSLQRAADSVGLSQRTLHRWLREPGFADEYRRARREAFSQAVALTQRCAPLAVNTLAKVMMDPASPTSAKVSAAVAVLRFGREGLEIEDIEVRVAALEQAARAEGRTAA